jgi:hypothetical protein
MSCVAPGCKSGYGSDCKLPPGVTKHIFPKEDSARRAWIEAVPRDDWEPSNSSILCSLHFTDDDFQVGLCCGSFLKYFFGWPMPHFLTLKSNK